MPPCFPHEPGSHVSTQRSSGAPQRWHRRQNPHFRTLLPAPQNPAACSEPETFSFTFCGFVTAANGSLSPSRAGSLGHRGHLALPSCCPGSGQGLPPPPSCWGRFDIWTTDFNQRDRSRRCHGQALPRDPPKPSHPRYRRPKPRSRRGSELSGHSWLGQDEDPRGKCFRHGFSPLLAGARVARMLFL